MEVASAATNGISLESVHEADEVVFIRALYKHCNLQGEMRNCLLGCVKLINKSTWITTATLALQGTYALRYFRDLYLRIHYPNYTLPKARQKSVQTRTLLVGSQHMHEASSCTARLNPVYVFELLCRFNQHTPHIDFQMKNSGLREAVQDI